MSNESELPAGRPAETHPTTLGSVGPGYEVRDTNVWAILTFAAGLIITLAVAQVGLWGVLRGITGRPAPVAPPSSPYAESASPKPGLLPPGGKVTPEVVLEITEQRRELNAEEADLLGGYAWVADNPKKPGVPAPAEKDRRVRIPIDRAIDLIAAKGMPATGQAPRTEIEVNSHSGEAAPAGRDTKGGTGSEAKDRGAPEKGSTK